MDEKLFVLQNLDIREIVNLNVKCIHHLAYFPLDEGQSKISNFFYQIRAAVILAFAYFQVSSEIANMISVFGDIEQMTAASFVLLSNLVHSVKLYYFIFQRSKVKELIQSMNQPEFKPQNKTHYKILVKEIEMSKLISKVFLFMCCYAGLLWTVFPFLDRKDGENLRLPLSGLYPFDTKKSPIFEIIFAYQVLATCINGFRNISVDTFISGSIMVISGQLSVLNNSFQTLNSKRENSSQFGQTYTDYTETIFIRNVIHYKSIIRYANDFSSLFGKCLISQFVVSVVIICITMFQMSLVSPLSLEFFSMLLYQSCMLLEIFLWCYYGNEVILKSTNLTTSAFSGEWVNCPKTFKQDLLFFMTRSQEPLNLYAGGYFILSINTFMAILKSAWSYFAVLNTVQSRKRVGI